VFLVREDRKKLETALGKLEENWPFDSCLKSDDEKLRETVLLLESLADPERGMSCSEYK